MVRGGSGPGGGTAVTERLDRADLRTVPAVAVAPPHPAVDFQSIVESATDLIARFDRDLRHVYVNPAAAAAGLLEQDAYVGRTIAESGVPEPGATIWEARLRSAFDTGETVDVVDSFSVGGEARWFSTRFVPERGADGSVVTVLSVARDVTDRHRAEEAVRASEARYRGLFAGSSLGMVTCRVHRAPSGHVDDWTYEDVNEAYLRITGFTHVIGKRLTQILPEVLTRDPALVAFYDRVVTTGSPDAYEMRIASLERWFSVHAFRSAPETFTAILADVTDRNVAQEEVRHIADDLREAQRLAQVGSWAWDATKDEARYSDEMYAILGLEPGSPPGSGADRARHYTPESTTAVSAAVARLFETGEPYEVDVDVVRPDGTLRRATARGEAVRDPDGRIAGIHGTLQDVTERVRAEAADRERAERDVLLVELSADAIFRIDGTDGRITDANPAACDIFGRSPQELVGSIVRDLFDDEANRAWRLLRPRVLAGETCTIEGRALSPEGIARMVSARIRRLPDRSFLVDARDVTHERLIAQQLEHAQRMDAIGRLAGGIAHDFNNVLTVIDGYAALLQEEMAAEDPRQADVAAIRDAEARASGLARQLLAFARRQERRPVTTDLDATIGQVGLMLRRLVADDIRLVIEPAAPAARVLVDHGQFEQVLVNLTVNARDAMSAGGCLTIRTDTTQVASDDPRPASPVAPGGYARIDVSDTGSGIDPAVLGHIFEPFYATKQEGKGTGLGLAIVEGIVSQSGGFVVVDSRLGVGTTFSIHLPLAESDPADGPEDEPPAPEPRGTGWVLAVEDDPAVLEVVRRTLVELGYSVIATADPAVALSIAADPDQHLDLLATDVLMPEIDGRTLARRVRALRPGLPVVLMSAYAQEGPEGHTFEPIDAEFIAKPFTRSTLAVAVRDALAPYEGGSGSR